MRYDFEIKGEMYALSNKDAMEIMKIAKKIIELANGKADFEIRPDERLVMMTEGQ